MDQLHNARYSRLPPIGGAVGVDGREYPTPKGSLKSAVSMGIIWQSLMNRFRL